MLARAYMRKRTNFLHEFRARVSNRNVLATLLGLAQDDSKKRFRPTADHALKYLDSMAGFGVPREKSQKFLNILKVSSKMIQVAFALELSHVSLHVCFASVDQGEIALYRFRDGAGRRSIRGACYCKA